MESADNTWLRCLPVGAPAPKVDPSLFERIEALGLLGVLQRRLPPGQRSSALLARLAATECAQEAALQRLLRSRPAGLRVLVVKGASLSTWAFEAGERVRTDDDLWVPESQRHRARQWLTSAGYQPLAANCSDWVLPQLTFRVARGTVTHSVDLHWRLSSRVRLSRALDFERIWKHATAFGDQEVVRQPDPTDALILASAHLFGHRAEEAKEPRRLFDYVRIVERRQGVLDQHLLERARIDGLSGLVAAGLKAAADCFDWLPPSGWVEALEADGARQQATLLARTRSEFRRKLDDFLSLPDGSARLLWTREHFWPSARVLEQRYGVRGRFQRLRVRLKHLL